jgi:uncharacterized protein YjbI with pentapeptide repeats
MTEAVPAIVLAIPSHPHPRSPDPPDLPADAPRLAQVTIPDDERLEAVVLDAVDLSAARLQRLSVVDVHMHGGSLANAAGRGSRWVRVEVAGARLTGLDLPEADLRDVVVRDCRADLTSFARARLQRVWFERCELTEADFLDADLREVRFVDCDLSRTDFRGARLQSCELRGVRLDGMAGVERLRGAALPMPDVIDNAATLAAALGLRMLDD